MQKYRAIKYIRLSHSDDRNNESDSVDNQRKLLTEFIAKNPDIQDMGEKVDDGYTGILFDRPSFKELMEMIEAGEINCVVVKDMSRLGREFIETGTYLRRIFPAYGVRFISLLENMDTAKGTEMDDISVSIKSAINDAYCRDISQKTRSALAAKRQSGDYVGAYTIYGYIKAKDNHNRLVIDPYPAGIVQEIYHMKIDGMSAAGIAEELNRRGVLSPLRYKLDRGLPCAKGGFGNHGDAKWSAKAVIRILEDETYTGTLIQNKTGTPNYKTRDSAPRPRSEWVVTEDAHEAIIPRQDFELVRRLCLLDTRPASGGKTTHLFSGLIICGCCGNRMTRKTVPYKGKTYHYYGCPTGKKNGCEKPVTLREDTLTACVLESIRAHIDGLVSLETLMQTKSAQQDEDTLLRRYRAQIEENERQIAQASGYKASLYQCLMDGNLTKEEHRALKTRYTEDIKRLTDANAQLEQALKSELNDSNTQWLEQAKAFAGLEKLDRRTLVHLIQTIRVMGKTDLQITFAWADAYENALSKLREGAA